MENHNLFLGKAHYFNGHIYYHLLNTSLAVKQFEADERGGFFTEVTEV